MKHKGDSDPPGRRRIILALTALMYAKDFNSVTTAEIAEKAGVAEGLIYKYFKNKKDLLYQVLHELFTQYHQTVSTRIGKKTSALEKLEIVIFSGIEYYSAHRVFARMLLLEVRNSQEYFSSPAYEMVKIYTRTLLEIIREGIRTGELKADIDPLIFRKVILGAIEHACLGEIIFSRELDAAAMAKMISTIVFNGAREA